MTTQEFEDYLVSIGGLVNGHYSNRKPIINNICECNEGWLQMIHDLIEEAIKAGWNKEICQIKEKFGGLRFYINSASDEVHDIISKYEKLSYKTCEICGSTDDVETGGKGWIQSLCLEHRKK